MRNHLITAALVTAFILLANAFVPPLKAQFAVVGECQDSLTVFHDISRFGRRNSAAENMTKDHERHARDGWRFQDMEPYVENGDLEGFFLTYSRPASCAS